MRRNRQQIRGGGQAAQRWQYETAPGISLTPERIERRLETCCQEGRAEAAAYRHSRKLGDPPEEKAARYEALMEWCEIRTQKACAGGTANGSILAGNAYWDFIAHCGSQAADLAHERFLEQLQTGWEGLHNAAC